MQFPLMGMFITEGTASGPGRYFTIRPIMVGLSFAFRINWRLLWKAPGLCIRRTRLQDNVTSFWSGSKNPVSFLRKRRLGQGRLRGLVTPIRHTFAFRNNASWELRGTTRRVIPSIEGLPL